ncbi:hypothetical protein KCU67_g82, partial [Aureobasidium melanogenum]
MRPEAVLFASHMTELEGSYHLPKPRATINPIRSFSFERLYSMDSHNETHRRLGRVSGNKERERDANDDNQTLRF